MLDDTRALFQAAIAEGWAVDGFVYTVDWDGAPVVRERMHWVAAEATATAAALHERRVKPPTSAGTRPGASTSRTASSTIVLGSWRHELSPLNRPSGVIWNGRPDIYHAVQATIIPRFPLAPTLATALRDGHLR